MDIRDAFDTAPYETRKHSSYFDTYEELLGRYQGLPLTFVEVGVLNGGSLFMWRSYFGPEARIIGVDFNPGAKQWEREGFEIHIGNQSDPDFWADFFRKVGKIDVLLDDGGHTFPQQIVTCDSALPWVKDGGLLIIEDTHTSYMASFGAPSGHSFISYAKNLVDGINHRSGVLRSRTFEREVASIAFYESIVALRIDRTVSREKSSPVINRGKSFEAADYRHADSKLGWAVSRLTRQYAHIAKAPVIGKPAAAAWQALSSTVYWTRSKLASARLGRYFRYR
jgi:hypothetical protein